MGVHSGNDQVNVNPQQDGTVPPSPTEQPSRGEDVYRNSYTNSLADQLGSTYGSRGLTGNRGSADLSRYMELFEREIEDIRKADKSMSLSLIQMDAGIYRTHASAIILINRYNDGKQTINAVHVFLLEATMVQELKARPLQNAYVGQTQLAVPHTTSDILGTKFFRQQLKECLQTASGGISREESTKVIDGGNVVIPRVLVPSPENEQHLRNIVLNGALATHHAIMRATNSMRCIDLSNEHIRKLPLKVEPCFNTSPIIGPNGLPVRADVQISLVQRSKDTDSLDGPAAGDSILTVSGFVDQIYVGPEQQTQMYNYYNPQQLDMRRFVPRFVMTATDTYQAANGPAFTLLAMAVSTVLQYPNPMNPYWARTFTPDLSKPKGKKKDIRDIGVLGYDLNFSGDPTQRGGDYLDTKSGEYTEEMLVSFIGRTHYMDHFTYAMDVDPTQPGGWAQRMFLAAAVGKDVSVTRELHDTINRMTGGRYAVKMAAKLGDNWMTHPLVSYNNEVVMGGTYIDDEGQLQDVRRYDYVALLNELMPDRAMVNDFMSCMYNRAVSEEIRLANLFRLYNDVLHGFKLTNWFYRLNFEAVPLQCFIEAWQDCKTFPSTDLMANFNQTGHVDTSSFLQMGYSGATVGGFAAQTYMVPTADYQSQYNVSGTGFGGSLFG